MAGIRAPRNPSSLIRLHGQDSSMGAADPTYPLYPIACILAACMLLLVLFTSFIRQNWNLGVAFLCFWLFLENLTAAVNAIIWSDNADIKYYVYCDIVTHLDMITYVVKPMATLLITRRLYLIANLQSVELPGQSARQWNSVVEWTLGLFVPLLVAGPIYYVHQGTRFEIEEGFGCINDSEPSILELLTIESWALIPPLISVFYYCPKVIRTFYRQSRDVHSFLNSNTSVSRTNYLRILALASVDVLLTLPVGIANIILSVTTAVAQGELPFYWGWNLLHTDWEPVGVLYVEIKSFGTATLAQFYFNNWTSPVLAFVIFGLFGITSEARASYWRIICTIGGWVGWKPTARTRKGQQSLGEIEFGARPQDMSLGDVEMGPGYALPLFEGSFRLTCPSRSRRPSFVTPGAPATDQGCERTPGSAESFKEVRRTVSDDGEDEHRASIARTFAGPAVGPNPPVE
ncbi:STE3-domain-containing protein [Peniophora sp. CONT]|nr:STE3-domain-containing protein [Peniophora sp. CONT]